MAAPALVLFDGPCGLCNASVRWVIARDRHERFQFAALESRAARAALEEAGFVGELPDSMVLIEAGRVQLFSDAVLGVARGLGLPWSLLSAARWVPRPLRDGLYRWVAAHRGRREQACALPRPDQRERFLDADEAAATER